MPGKGWGTPGLPPGTLSAPVGAYVPKAIQVLHYTAEDVEEKEVASAEEAAGYRGQGGVTWVNVDGLGDAELIRALGERFGLHPLALEDVVSLRQRPKVDDYDSHIYGVLRMLHYEHVVETEQVSIFLGRDVVITFQEHPGD